MKVTTMKILGSGYLLMSLLLYPVSGYSADDAGLNHDYRTFHTAGNIAYGQIGNSYTADLVMYLAGNQFMVMENLIGDFQGKDPDIKSIYVETIPPGQILKQQLLKQGQINGQNKVGYAIGPLNKGRNGRDAIRFLQYLATDAAQDIYAQHGFLKAAPAELRIKPIPE